MTKVCGLIIILLANVSFVCSQERSNILTTNILSPNAISFTRPAFGHSDSLSFGSRPNLFPAHTDTIPLRTDWNNIPVIGHPFPLRSMILPGMMIAYGFVTLNSHDLKVLNQKVREEIWNDNPHKLVRIDDYLQFAPALAVYGLNMAGIHGKHNFRDRTMIYLISNVIAEGTVFSLKGTTHQQRPDGTTYNSFPSGHTAEAFASAEFLRQEYKDVSPWYGVAGYAAATATGFLRMYNNRHWLSDVVTGAGIGIASTRLAYWLYPMIQHAFGKGDKPVQSVLMPSYQNGSVGFAFVHQF